MGDVQVGERSLPPGSAAVLTLRIRQTQRSTTQTALAAHDGLERDEAARTPLGLEAPDLDVRVDVLPPHGALPDLPDRLVESLIAPAAVAVPVVEQSRLTLREHRVRLGELPEPPLRLGRVGNVRMPIARLRTESSLDRLLIRVTRTAEHLVLVAVDR